MVKRYFPGERPEERSKEEQAKINEQNFEEWRQSLIKVAQGAADYLHEQQKIGAALRRGNLAFVCEELSVLEFNGDCTVAKYDGKEVKFKKDGLESEMLSSLVRAANSKGRIITEDQLIGSLERATGRDDVIYKTVRNARDRINRKLCNGLGLTEVIRMVDRKYQLEGRYLYPSKK